MQCRLRTPRTKPRYSLTRTSRTEGRRGEERRGAWPKTRPPGNLVGDPVAATDEDDTTLTYTLGGTDAASFEIGRATGQISVGAGTTLDKETKETYSVTVTATDPSGATATIPVTIKVTGVDEPPTISVGSLEISGQSNVDYAENGADPVGTFTADGPDTATWTLSGDDMDHFLVHDGILTFAAPPNFEAPADADTDNVYQVTVAATAGGEMDEVAVSVTVTNADEEGDRNPGHGAIKTRRPDNGHPDRPRRRRER